MPEWLHVVLPVLGILGSAFVATFAVGRGLGQMQEGQRRFEREIEDRFKRIEDSVSRRVDRDIFAERGIWADERYNGLKADVQRIRDNLYDLRQDFHDFLMHASQESRAPRWLSSVVERVEERSRQRDSERNDDAK